MTATFRFIHTADWQIGAPFSSYESDLSARLREARVAVIERIGKLAQDKSVKHIIVAGDVWDSEQPSGSMIHQPLDIMGAATDVTWWLLPGNHDPHRRNMLWGRIDSRAPDNVHLMLGPEPIEAERGSGFAGTWTTKVLGKDLTEWMDEAKSKLVIPPDPTKHANLDYLALDDWHGVVEINHVFGIQAHPNPTDSAAII